MFHQRPARRVLAIVLLATCVGVQLGCSAPSASVSPSVETSPTTQAPSTTASAAPSSVAPAPKAPDPSTAWTPPKVDSATGPTLTRAELESWLTSGTVGLKKGQFTVGGASGSVEGKDDEEGVSATATVAPCAARAELASKHLVAVGADDEYSQVVQLFDSPESAKQLFITSQQCGDALDSLGIEEGSRVDSEGTTTAGGDWMLTQRAGGKSGPYRQAFVRWGNVVVTTLQDGTAPPTALADAVTTQVNHAAG